MDRDEANAYLDSLRESGITNMYGARPFLEKAFCISSDEAKKSLVDWMEADRCEKCNRVVCKCERNGT